MTSEAQNLLASFAQLSREEQLLVGEEIQRRLETGMCERENCEREDWDMSPPTDEEMIYMASKLFQMYDDEERQNGCP